jgi:predicted RNA binding protein YcfA (HicA-like mRNA interferase family)
MNLSPKYLISLLERNGFIFKRSKGSHHIYFNAATKKTIVVPIHGGRDLKKGTFLAIIKQAGIEIFD